MRTTHFGSVPVAGLALVTFLGGVTIAQKPSGAVMNTLELRHLVARAEPADHARLSAHFAALADRYAAEAVRHATMSRGFTGHPSRTLATDLGVHCTQLGSANVELENRARELATYHGKLATGTPSTPPRTSQRLEAGGSAAAPNEQELSEFLAKATASNDHKALEEYFLTLAKRYDRDADGHVGMANAYRGSRLAPVAVHCDRLGKLSRDAAQEARSAAAIHRKLADATS